MSDDTWSMPLANWQPTGSFREAATPPVGGPLDGDLVQLPCINVDWLPLVLGSLDQLRNPSTWIDTLSDSALESVLDRANFLRSLMAGAVNTPCCSVEMRLTSECELQFSVDGGATWTTVTDWDTYLDSCIKAHVPPAVPAPKNPGVPADNACGVSGYLTQELLQIATQKLADALTAGQAVDKFINEIVTTLVAVFPVLDFIVAPFEGMYSTALPQPLSDLQAAATDTNLFHRIQCAIYLATASTGYVNASNFASVASGIAGVSYAHAWVPVMLGNLFNSLGLTTIQAIQAQGSLSNAYCGDCSSGWCFEIDFTSSDHGWTDTAGLGFGTYVPGEGWQTTLDSSVTPHTQYLNIISPSFGGAFGNITGIRVYVVSTAYTGSGGHPRAFILYNGGVLQGFEDFPSNGAYPVYTAVAAPPFTIVPVDQLSLQWETDLGGSAVIAKVQISGTGSNPFGTNNCSF